jgi:hypothetical protein
VAPTRLLGLPPMLPAPPTGESDPSRFTPRTVAVITISVLVFLGCVIWSAIAYEYKGSTPLIALASGVTVLILLHVFGVHEIKKAVAQASAGAASAVVQAAVATQESALRIEAVANTAAESAGRIESKVEDGLKQAEERITVPAEGPLPPCIVRVIQETVTEALDKAFSERTNAMLTAATSQAIQIAHGMWKQKAAAAEAPKKE